MVSSDPAGPLVRTLFGIALATLGVGMQLACRLSERFRSQLTRVLTVQIGSADGVVHHYAFAPRTVTSVAGRASDPTLNLRFDNARTGLVTLLSPHAVGRIVHALLERRAEYQGNAVLVLWFFGLTRFVLPIARTKPLRVALPDAYIEPSPGGRVAERIVREPSADELDPAWLPAHRQRAKMVMLRGSAGEPVRLW